MIDRRVRIIRFYLMLAALAVATLIWPESMVWAWPLVGLIPCPDCCGGCTPVWEDDFATDQLSTDYTTISGTWSVGGGVLTTTSSGAVIVADAVGSTGHGRVSVDGKVSAVTNVFRAIGSYTDSNNYLFAEVTINTGASASTFKLWNRSGGTNTQIGVTCTFTGDTDSFYTVVLCWDGAFATATMTATSGGAQICGAAGSYTGSGNTAGLGGTGGTVTFDNFEFYPHVADDESCPGCGNYCPHCTTLPPTDRWQVTIPALPNGTCSNCGGYAGTYIVERLILVSSTHCIWRYYIDGEICDTLDGIQIGRSTFAGERLQISVINGLDINGGGGATEDTWTLTTEIDCDSYSSTSVPASNLGLSSLCGNVSAAATITSL